MMCFFLISGMNPWDVASLQQFSFFCCPECIYRSSDAFNFEDHALANHPLAKTFFLRGVVNPEDSFLVDPLAVKTEHIEDDCELPSQDAQDTEEPMLEEQDTTEEPMLDEQDTTEEPMLEEFDIKDLKHEDLKDHEDDITEEQFYIGIDKRKAYSVTICPICQLDLGTHKDMVKHRDNMHEVYPCPDCNKTWPTYKKLETHQRNHVSATCQDCGFKTTLASITVHRKLCKVYSGAFKCQRCFEKFDTLKEMVAHRDKAHVGDWPCTDCQPERIYGNFARFSSHKMKVHSLRTCHCGIQYRPVDCEQHERICTNKLEKQFSCLICEKLFDTQKDMVAHRNAAHDQFPCKKCDKIFSTFKQYNSHRNTHIKKPCEKCDEKVSVADISKHIKLRCSATKDAKKLSKSLRSIKQ